MRQINRPSRSAWWDTAKNYALNRSLREKAEAEEGRLKKDLLNILAEQEADEGGHTAKEDLEYPLQIGKKLVAGFKRQRRLSKRLNEDRATLFLDSKGLLQECQTTYTVLDEDRILAIAFQGKITDKELNELYDESETFALTLIEAEEDDD
jgi:hypothetical protein